MRLVLGWIWFAVVQFIELVDLIIGLVLLLPLAASKCWVTRESRYFPGKQVTVWRGGWLTWIWGNEEDGVTSEGSEQRAAEYATRYPNIRLRAYMWSALRNPANNLRFVFAWKGGPFARKEWIQTVPKFSKAWPFVRFVKVPFYAQAGYYPNGYPVLSAGGM